MTWESSFQTLYNKKASGVGRRRVNPSILVYSKKRWYTWNENYFFVNPNKGNMEFLIVESYYLLFFPNKDIQRLVRILLVSLKDTYILIHWYQAGFVKHRLNIEHLLLQYIHQCNGSSRTQSTWTGSKSTTNSSFSFGASSLLLDYVIFPFLHSSIANQWIPSVTVSPPAVFLSYHYSWVNI